MPSSLDRVHDQEERQSQRYGATAIQQHIAELTGPVGQKALVIFVRAGHKESCQNRQPVRLKLPHQPERNALQSNPESAETDQGEESVAQEVAGFADYVVDQTPMHAYIVAQDRLDYASQRSAGTVRS